MITMRSIAFSLCLFFVGSLACAQDFEVPEDIHLKKAEDFKRYEEDIVACAHWLLETPINTQEQKRAKANAFMMQWLIGSPSVSIELNAGIMTFMESSPELVIIFMSGWTAYVLEGGDKEDTKAATLAGLDYVMRFYTANSRHLGNDKNIERFFKLKEKDKLEQFVARNI